DPGGRRRDLAGGPRAGRGQPLPLLSHRQRRPSRRGDGGTGGRALQRYAHPHGRRKAGCHRPSSSQRYPRAPGLGTEQLWCNGSEAMADNVILPTYDQLIWPTLQTLKTLGGTATNQEVLSAVVELKQFTDDQLSILHRNGPQSEIG